MKVYLLAIGENQPDKESHFIQEGLSLLHKIPVNWSHIALLVESEEGEDPIANGMWDLTAKGWQHTAPAFVAAELEGCTIRHKIRLNIISAERTIGWLFGYRDTQYSLLQFALAAPKWLLKMAAALMPAWLEKKFRNGKSKGYCSEGGARFMVDNCPTAAGDPRLADAECDNCDPVKAIRIANDYGAAECVHLPSACC